MSEGSSLDIEMNRGDSRYNIRINGFRGLIAGD